MNTLGKDVTPTDVRKAFSILIKCQVLKRLDIEKATGETIWGIVDKDMTSNEMLIVRDLAIVARLLNACQEEDISFDASVVSNILYSTKKQDDVVKIIEDARRMCTDNNR